MEYYEYDYLITKPELNEDLLMHFGVKGMRWGHRKQRPVSALKRAGKAARPQSPVKAAKMVSNGVSMKRQKKKDVKKSMGYKLASSKAGQAGIKTGKKMQNPETQKRVKTALKAAALTAGIAVADMGVHTFVTSPYAKGNRMYVAGKTKEFIYNQGRKFADSVVQRRKNRAARKYVKTLPRIGAKKIIDTTARFV